MLTRPYVRLIKSLRSVLASIGILRVLDRYSNHRSIHWLRSQFAVHDVEDLVSLGSPWWSYKAADAVEVWAANKERPLRAFEWGAGASSMWLADRVDELHSVEHHTGFASTVQAMAPDHMTLHVVEPTERGPNPYAPSKKRGHEDLDFEEYVRTIDVVGGMFDMIVIDGRARATCFRHALPHLAPGGIIIFDNSSRSEYRAAMATADVVVEDYKGLTPAHPFLTTTSLVRSSSQG